MLQLLENNNVHMLSYYVCCILLDNIISIPTIRGEMITQMHRSKGRVMSVLIKTHNPKYLKTCQDLTAASSQTLPIHGPS